MYNEGLACNDQLLKEMVDSHHSADDFAELLQHVECCQRCQQRLDELAADSTLWSSATVALTGFASSDPFRNSMGASYGQQLHGPVGHNLAWTESMARQLLSPASHPEMLGRIGRYEVERLIGSGGMGIVFKAIDTELNRPVAIKLLAPYLAGNGAARQRFAREAKAAAAVVHEHVVPIHNVETDGHSPYLVMRYVAGESLQARIDREGALELCQILRISMQIASGLTAAHAQGLVHRDIKPANILVESGVERSLITDFGLARAADDASLTNTGYHPGTPQYMSPEQARGDSMDSRSDLFSLGSVMYTMCTGRPPFRAETSYGILRRITDTQPRPIQEINPSIPGWLCCMIAKLMDKTLEARVQSADQLEQLLEGCLAHVQRPQLYPLPSAVADWEKSERRKQANLSSRFRSARPASKVLLAILGVSILTLAAWWSGIFKNINATSPGAAQSNANQPESAQLESSQSKIINGNAGGNLSSNAPNNANGLSTDQAVQEGARAKQPRRQRFATPEDPTDRIRTVLAGDTEVNLESVSLSDCVGGILEGSGVTYQINLKSFRDAGLQVDQLISIEGKGPRYALLEVIFARYSAAYLVRENSIEVVSAEFARSNPTLRYYDLSYLLADSGLVESIIAAVKLVVFRPDELTSSASYSCTLLDSVLVVRATESDHHQVERLLAELSVTLQASSHVKK